MSLVALLVPDSHTKARRHQEELPITRTPLPLNLSLGAVVPPCEIPQLHFMPWLHADFVRCSGGQDGGGNGDFALVLTPRHGGTKKNSQSPERPSLSTSPLVPLCLCVRTLNCTSYHVLHADFVRCRDAGRVADRMAVGTETLPFFSHQGTEAPRRTPNHQNAPPSQPLPWCLCAFV